MADIDLNRGRFFCGEDMIQTILGIKLDQSQQFTQEGLRIPVSHIQAGPCWVIAVRDMGTYKSLQLGFGTKKNISKAIVGHIKKAGLEIKPRFLREIRTADLGNLQVGQEIKINDIFEVGDAIRVTGTSKGKGFAGVVKRHGFAGGPRTHGQSDRERAPGSIGQTTTPGRVYKGKRMAGRMGGKTVTVRHLSVVAIDADKNILTVKGVIPGASKGLLLVSKEDIQSKPRVDFN